MFFIQINFFTSAFESSMSLPLVRNAVPAEKNQQETRQLLFSKQNNLIDAMLCMQCLHNEAPDPHQLITCPYNMSHQVEHYRMHIHLQKCRKQYPDCKKQTCPFDATHVVNDVELDYHVQTCPKRNMLDEKMFVLDNDYRPVVEVQATTSAVECEEDWETTNTTTYIPDPAKKGPHIINKIKGATPSERRKARMQGIQTYRPPV